MNSVLEFSPAVIEKLGYYVYLLIDPRTSKVFYVGKGTGNRVFQHLGEAAISSKTSEKAQVIRDITAAGLKVECVIHRHGLTEKEAFEVESALIDFIGLPELANLVSGYDADERGRMAIDEVIVRYEAPVIEIAEPSILIIVNKRYYRGIGADELYEITRASWKVAPGRRRAKYAFAVYNGVVREVYEIDGWRRHEARPGRWIFDGRVAANLRHYVGGSVTKYIRYGAQNPIKYINC